MPNITETFCQVLKEFNVYIQALIDPLMENKTR